MRSHSRVVALVAVALSFLVSSCAAERSATPNDPARRLPVHRDLGAFPLGEITGVITKDNGCVYIHEGSAGVLLIWPSDAWLDGDVVVRGQTPVAVVGQAVHLNGGFLPYDAVRETMDADIPACRTTQFFLVNGNTEPCDLMWIPVSNGSFQPECRSYQGT